MKIKPIVNLLVLSLILSGGAVGCKKKLQKTTPLPGRSASIEGDAATGPMVSVPPVEPTGLNEGVLEAGTEGGIPQVNDFSSWEEDRTTFATETVYFDFDKSNIKSSEVGKIENVANLFKNMPTKALRIEGHCDERGTEEYNRALGERRALSVREYLITLGVDASRVETRSYGEDRPVNPEPTEAAYAQNRRGEFIVLTKPGSN